MHVLGTLAALRTDRQALFGVAFRPALSAVRQQRLGPVPAVPRASARVLRAARTRGALGRWRCRWIAHPQFGLEARRAVGIGRRASRCPLSPGAWSSTPFSVA